MAPAPLSRGYSLLLREISAIETGVEHVGRSVYFMQALGECAELLDAAASPQRLIKDPFLLASDEQFRAQFEAAASRLRAMKVFADARGLTPGLLRETADARFLANATGCDALAILRETLPGRESRRVSQDWRLSLRQGSIRSSELVARDPRVPAHSVRGVLENPLRWNIDTRGDEMRSAATLDSFLLRLFESSQLPAEPAKSLRELIRGLLDQADPDEQRRIAATELSKSLIQFCTILEQGATWEGSFVASVTDCFSSSEDSTATLQSLIRGLEFAASCCEHRFCGMIEDTARIPEWQSRTAFGEPPTALEVDFFAVAVVERFCEIALEPTAAPAAAIHLLHGERASSQVLAKLAKIPLPCVELTRVARAGLLFARDHMHAEFLKELATAIEHLQQAAKIGWVELRRGDLSPRTRVARLRKQTERLREAAAAQLMAMTRRSEWTPGLSSQRVAKLLMLLTGTGATVPAPSDAAAFRAIRLQLV